MLATFFLATVFLATVFLAVRDPLAGSFAAAFLAGALRAAGRFLGAGPLARLSASSSAARSAVIVSTSSSRRSVACHCSTAM